MNIGRYYYIKNIIFTSKILKYISVAGVILLLLNFIFFAFRCFLFYVFTKIMIHRKPETINGNNFHYQLCTFDKPETKYENFNARYFIINVSLLRRFLVNFAHYNLFVPIYNNRDCLLRGGSETQYLYLYFVGLYKIT